jgi:hypothetical protein
MAEERLLPPLPITLPDFEAGQRMRKKEHQAVFFAGHAAKKHSLSSSTCPGHCDLKNFFETVSWKVSHVKPYLLLNR